MPKISSRPSSPMMRRSTARKVIGEGLSSERKIQDQIRQEQENTKNRMVAALQKKQSELNSSKDDIRPRSTFLKKDPVVSFRENRQDRFISSLSANLNVMIQAVQKAGRNLIRDFGELESLQVSQKSATDFVSSANINTEKTLREYLLKVRPRYGFLQEECGEISGLDTSHRWIVDPLNGATNFIHAIPHFSISLALQEDQEIIAGVVYNPITNDLFYAEKGNGAWELTQSGSTRLHVSGRNNLNESVIATDIFCLGHKDTALFKKQLDTMMKLNCELRHMGVASLDLAYLAAGKFECYWEQDIKPWNVAAGLLIVKEAGGRICSFEGDESFKQILNSKSVIATNSAQYDSFKKLLLETL